ncbi:MAG: SDR family oxidoreductase [Verrucomicrobiota bacterium JB022]|nr:SDR family oxidoreductase [Verrucomicrobiota bacterium JB022]
MSTTDNSHPARVAIVTGSSRGIGAAIAQRLAADGFAVVVNYAGRADAAEQVVSHIESAGGQAMAVQADVSKVADAARLFERAVEAFGGVDVLVNSAGVIQPGFVNVADTDEELFDHIVAVNLKGTYNTLRLAAEHLRQGGSVVNFSTSVVGLSLPGYSAYAATKAGVESLTHIFAKELRGRSITVNAVAPGPVATELFLKDKTDEQVERLAKMPPLERLGKPEDIAPVVAFLVGPEGGWINGQVIRANGGLV